MTHLGILFDIPFLITTFYFMIKYKDTITNLFLKIKIPIFLLCLLSSIPFIIVEENINCGAFSCNYTLFPFTLPFLLIYMLIIGFFYLKFTPKSHFKFILIFSIIGILFEIFFGVSNSQFKLLPSIWFIFISIWVGISYSYFMVIPLLILKSRQNN